MPLICLMFPIYFDYEEQSKTYIYKERSVEYRMPLPLMLKFKKHFRENSTKTDGTPIKSWFSTLNPKELAEVSIKELAS